MTNLDPTQAALQREELRLRWYQSRLGFWQAIWGTLVTGGIAIAIPAAVDAYKVFQERKLKEQEIALKDRELQGKVLDSHQQYISSFLNTALNQDIELRIRFSEYFSFVSDPKYKDGWEKFRGGLERRRNEIRSDINRKETRVDKLRVDRAGLRVDEQIELASLERELRWHYAELGYVRQDSSVTAPSALTATDFNGALEAVDSRSLFKFFGVPSTTTKTKPDECNELNGTKLRANLAEYLNPTGEKVELLKPAAESLKRIIARIAKDEPELARTIIVEPQKCAFYSEQSKSFEASAWGVSIRLGGQYRSTLPAVFSLLFSGPSSGLSGLDPVAIVNLLRIARYFRDEQWYWGGGAVPRRTNYFVVSAVLFDQWVEKGEVK